MLKLLLLCALVGSAAAAWIGEEYWTTIGFDGRVVAGQSQSNFARLDDDHSNLFVAFWMTRSLYPGEHFESFGYAHVRPDGRICGLFVGMNKERQEVCGGFRVLSVPQSRRGEKLFEWVPASRSAFASTIGFHDHRVAKFDNGYRNITYGDAKPKQSSFAAVQRTEQQELFVGEPEFSRHVSLLRLLVAEVPPVRTGSLSAGRDRPYYAPQQQPYNNYNYNNGPAPQPQYQPQPQPQPQELASAERLTIYVPKQLIKDQRGRYYEVTQIDGRVIYKEVNARDVQEAIRQHGAQRNGAVAPDSDFERARIGEGARPAERREESNGIGNGARHSWDD